MVGKPKLFAVLFTGVVLASLPAHADSKLVQGKRFISLDATRAGQPAKRTPQVQRSDAQAMRSGFLRLDRDLVINAKRAPRVVKASEPQQVALLKPNDAPVITRGNTVTELFGDNGGAEAPVFGETLRNTESGTTASGRGHIWPIAKSYKQELSSGYGMRKDPFHGQQRFHGGIDIAAATGTPVMATAGGVVTESGNGGKFGNYVAIQHADGSESMYGHLSAQSVKKGQRVNQGQVIGKVGSTGRSTGPHLDYRIKKNGQRINPMTVLNAPQGKATNVAQVIQVR